MTGLAQYPKLNPANAGGRILAMLFSGFLIAFCVLFLRWPGINTSIIMCSQLNVFMNYDTPLFSERLRRIFLTTVLGGLFQFVLGMISGRPVLLLCTLFFGILLILYILRNEAAEAVLIVIVGVLSLSGTGGFLNGINQFIMLQYSAIWAFCGTVVIQRIIPRQTDALASMPKHSLNFSRAFIVALQVTFGIWLWKVTRIPQGIWIALTMLLTHISGIFGDRAVLRASVRMIMGPIGFIFGFLYLAVFCWFDYRMAYLFPVFLALGFYSFFRYGSYRWNMFFQMIFFVLLYDILNGEYKQLDLMNLLVTRTFAIMVGGFLALFSDPERTVPVNELIQFTH